MDRHPRDRSIESRHRSIQPEETIGKNTFYSIFNDGYIEGVGMNRCFHIALFQGNEAALKRYFNDPLCSFPEEDRYSITNISSNPNHRKSVRDYVEKNNVCVEIYANHGGKVSLVETFSSEGDRKKKKKIFIFSFGEHFEQMVASDHPEAKKCTLSSNIRTRVPEEKLSPRAIEEINKDINRAADAQNPDILRAIELSMKHTGSVQNQSLQQVITESKKLTDQPPASHRRASQSRRRVSPSLCRVSPSLRRVSPSPSPSHQRVSHQPVQQAFVDIDELQFQQALEESKQLAIVEERKRIQKLVDEKKQQEIRNDAARLKNDEQLAKSLAETYKKEYAQYLKDEDIAQQLASQYMIDNERVADDARYAKNLFIE
jgi:hypothetical protein